MQRLESTRHRGIRRLRPSRNWAPVLRPVGCYETKKPVIPLARKIVHRIRRNRQKMAAGSYVLGDSSGRVYVVSEGASLAAVVFNRHIAWLIGVYASGECGADNCVAYPSEADLVDDLHAHYAAGVADGS